MGIYNCAVHIMPITRTDLQGLRLQYLNDATSRGSLENDVELIKISALIANNAGFTVYKSFPTGYEELVLHSMVQQLSSFFEDSLVTFNVENETGKATITIDWTDLLAPLIEVEPEPSALSEPHQQE
jgi:hypothetical protein